MERSEMKNLKTGNYTEFRDLSNGFHLRHGELNMTNLGCAKVSINLFQSEQYGNHNLSIYLFPMIFRRNKM